jgi:hypothetical protein
MNNVLLYGIESLNHRPGQLDVRYRVDRSFSTLAVPDWRIMPYESDWSQRFGQLFGEMVEMKYHLSRHCRLSSLLIVML